MSYQLADLVRIMACLRDAEHGCPWDRSQTYRSIVPCTLEEAYEVSDVIERGEFDELCAELGDLLFQVVFYARLAEEDGLFSLDDVIDAIVSKLLTRHPHVFPDATFQSFGDSQAASVQSIKQAWEAKKADERASRGQFELFDDVPFGLPALSRAQKIQKRALKVGFDWSSIVGVFEKIDEELIELQTARADENSAAIQEEYGDLLFTIVSLGRHLGLDSEQALRLATQKFEYRIETVNRLAKAQGIDLAIATDNEINGLWDQVKAL